MINCLFLGMWNTFGVPFTFMLINLLSRLASAPTTKLPYVFTLSMLFRPILVSQAIDGPSGLIDSGPITSLYLPTSVIIQAGYSPLTA